MNATTFDRRVTIATQRHFYNRVFTGEAAPVRIGATLIVSLSTAFLLGWQWGVVVTVSLAVAFFSELALYRWFLRFEPNLEQMDDAFVSKFSRRFLNGITGIVALYSLPYALITMAPQPGPLLALLFSLGTLVVVTGQHTLTRSMVFRTIPVPAITLIIAASSFETGWMAYFCGFLALMLVCNVIALTQASFDSSKSMIDAQLKAEDASEELALRERQLRDADIAKGDLIVRLTEARKEQEQTSMRLQFLSDNSIDAIGLLGSHGRAVSISAAVTRILGWTPEEFIEKSQALIHPDDVEVSEKAALDFRLSPQNLTLEQRYQHKAGHYVSVEARFNPVFDADGTTLIGCVATLSDLTERNRNAAALAAAEARVREQARQLQLINDNGSDAVGLMDSRGAVSTVSKGITRILGWEPSEFIGQKSSFIHPEDRVRVTEGGLTHWKAREPFRIRFRSKHRDGHYVWVESRIRPIVDAETGLFEHAVFVTSDVSAQRAHEEALELAWRDAEAATIAKSQFLATMSHELRTPMSGIMGMLELLMRTDLSPEQRDQALTAQSSANALLVLLNDILDYSKLEANQIKFEKMPVKVCSLVDDVRALFRQQAGEKNIEIKLADQCAVPAWLETDPARLRQVLINLVGNALKFTPSGFITIALKYAAGMLRVEVHDTGIGISEEARSRLFQRFMQADASTSRRYGGTGLGLAICKQLVELMGGSIGVESALGQGSVFWFTIAATPCAALQAEPPEPHAFEVDEAEEETPGLKILVAEDHPVNQKIIAAFLQPFGHELTIVSNGAQAIELLKVQPFDLVLMDIQMPVLDGISATQAIRAFSGPVSGIPIVALTANAMAGDRETYLEAGMDDYVSKPLDPIKLAEALDRAAKMPWRSAVKTSSPALATR